MPRVVERFPIELFGKCNGRINIVIATRKCETKCYVTLWKLKPFTMHNLKAARVNVCLNISDYRASFSKSQMHKAVFAKDNSNDSLKGFFGEEDIYSMPRPLIDQVYQLS